MDGGMMPDRDRRDPSESSSTSPRTKVARAARPGVKSNATNDIRSQEFQSRVTDGVHISVRVRYRSDISEPVALLFVWMYEVTIRNLRNDVIRVKEREWCITDDCGNKEDVYGKGIVGTYPQIDPGAQFSYVSGVPLRTAKGTMKGAFEIIPAVGQTFWAEVPEFRLSSIYPSGSTSTDVVPDYRIHARQFSHNQVQYICRILRNYQEDAGRCGESRFSVSNLKALPPTLKLTFMRILMACRIYGERGQQFFINSNRSHLNFSNVFNSNNCPSIDADDVFIHASTLEGDVDISVATMREEDNYEVAKRAFLERWAKKQNQPIASCRDALDGALNNAEAEIARRTKPPRLKWPKDALPHEIDNPAAFAWRAYATESKAGTLHMKMIRQEDRQNGTTLAVDLVSWLRSRKNQLRIPEGFDIPTIEDWYTRQLAVRSNPLKTNDSMPVDEAIRMHAVAAKRAQKERKQGVSRYP